MLHRRSSLRGHRTRLLFTPFADFLRDQFLWFTECAFGTVEGLDQRSALGVEKAKIHLDLRHANTPHLVEVAFSNGERARQG